MCFRIVGEDDGGTLFTPEEYEDYKKRVLPMRMKNRLFVSWTAPNGMDCKMIGPETMCFCNHRYNYKMLKLTLNVNFDIHVTNVKVNNKMFCKS